MYLNLYIPSNKCYLSKAFQLEDRLEMLNVFLLHKRKLKSRIHQIKGKIIVIVNKFKACVVLAGTQKAQWSIMINYAVRMHSSPLHAPTQVNGKKSYIHFRGKYQVTGWKVDQECWSKFLFIVWHGLFLVQYTNYLSMLVNTNHRTFYRIPLHVLYLYIA